MGDIMLHTRDFLKFYIIHEDRPSVLFKKERERERELKNLKFNGVFFFYSVQVANQVDSSYLVL
jgi:hypothetical protein